MCKTLQKLLQLAWIVPHPLNQLTFRKSHRSIRAAARISSIISGNLIAPNSWYFFLVRIHVSRTHTCTYTVYIVHYTLYIIHYTLYSIYYALYIVHYALSIVHYTCTIIYMYLLYNIHYACILYIVYIVQVQYLVAILINNNN